MNAHPADPMADMVAVEVMAVAIEAIVAVAIHVVVAVETAVVDATKTSKNSSNGHFLSKRKALYSFFLRIVISC